MFNFKQSLLVLIAMLALCGVEPHGQSFVIPDVQGAVYVSTSLDGGPPTLKLGPVFDLSGPGLTIFTQPHPSGDPGIVEARDTCLLSSCTPGQVVGTNSSFSGLIGSQFFTSARVNGVFYSMVRVTGSLNFLSQPIVIPTRGGDAIVTIPFTFSGQLTGDAFQPNVTNPVFVATLSGQGRARFRFVLIGFDIVNPRYKLEEIEYLFEPVLIAIDIKPLTFPNTINPNSKGKIAVAVLTTPSFDASTVDPATLRFGATGIEAAPVQFAMEDVDGDGDVDMVVHFATQDTGITCGSTSASLTGATFGGMKFKGSDSVATVGCNKPIQ